MRKDSGIKRRNETKALRFITEGLRIFKLLCGHCPQRHRTADMSLTEGICIGEQMYGHPYPGSVRITFWILALHPEPPTVGQAREDLAMGTYLHCGTQPGRSFSLSFTSAPLRFLLPALHCSSSFNSLTCGSQGGELTETCSHFEIVFSSAATQLLSSKTK